MKRVKETKLKLEKKEANIVGHLCYAAFKLWNVPQRFKNLCAKP